MQLAYRTLLGKGVQKAARLRGGGSALPGLFIERIDPNFIRRTLADPPRGVVVVSGTNGKTTTTKMVVELLEGQGLKVFTNRTGSNFTRGVAAALLGEVDRAGRLAADIAVLELDEAHAVHFVRTVAPRYSLILNVMRDQLDRFGEIDHTARLLRAVASATTHAVVLNREDARVAAIAGSIDTAAVSYFGLAPRLRQHFPSDDDLHQPSRATIKLPAADVTLERFADHHGTFGIAGKQFETPLKLEGIYNTYNAAAAMALVRAIMGKQLQLDALIASLAEVTPAFGRGESLMVHGQPLELVLVKNPSGFRLGLSSFDPDGYATMIAINDNYADGRDMSWLWDVDFASLRPYGVAMVAGIRAYDMALRLQYDEVALHDVVPDLSEALARFVQSAPDQPKRIYCTYTAMLALRRKLAKITEVKDIT